MVKEPWSDTSLQSYAGINLTGYHPPPPPAPRDLCTEMCAQPQSFCTTENAWGRANKWRCSGAGHLHQHKECQHSHVSLRIELPECPKGLAKSRRLRTLCQTAYLLSAHILALWLMFSLHADLGLSIPLSFIDKCISTSAHSTIYWQYTFETSHLPPLFDLLPSTDPGHKKF